MRLLLQFSINETCFWKNEAILYWCTISRNAFIVGFVGFIYIYMFSKERGNTILYMHNCRVAINVFHKERGNTVCMYAEINCSVGIYMFFEERRNTIYAQLYRLKITPPTPSYHQTPSSPPDNSWNHPTPSDTTLQASDKNWPSDTILHHFHHLTADAYIGHICVLPVIGDAWVHAYNNEHIFVH
jgi:hypothetical protein